MNFCAKKVMLGACFVKIFLQKAGISDIGDMFSVKQAPQTFQMWKNICGQTENKNEKSI